MRIFDDNTKVVSVAVLYLLIVPISYGARGVIMISCATFNGLGKPLASVVMILSRSIVLYLPLAYLGKWLLGYKGVFIGASVCNLSIGLLGIIWTMRIWRGRASTA